MYHVASCPVRTDHYKQQSVCVCIYYTYICSVDHVMKEIFVYCNYWKIWLSLALQSVPNF